MAEGRGGVVENSWTTPPRLARTNEASRLFLLVQPPLLLLRRGVRWNPYPVFVCARTSLRSPIAPAFLLLSPQ